MRWNVNEINKLYARRMNDILIDNFDVVTMIDAKVIPLSAYEEIIMKKDECLYLFRYYDTRSRNEIFKIYKLDEAYFNKIVEKIGGGNMSLFEELGIPIIKPEKKKEINITEEEIDKMIEEIEHAHKSKRKL